MTPDASHVTYLLRHARTSSGAGQILNGDPSSLVSLDRVGVRQCSTLADEEWLADISVCLTSGFLRTQETADLLLRRSTAARVVEEALNEIDYGDFEGHGWSEYGHWLRTHGPAARPPNSAESWSLAVGRVFGCLVRALDCPGPRLVVGHGFWISAVTALRGGTAWWPRCADLPGAPHVRPAVFSDTELRSLMRRGNELMTGLSDQPPWGEKSGTTVRFVG